MHKKLIYIAILLFAPLMSFSQEDIFSVFFTADDNLIVEKSNTLMQQALSEMEKVKSQDEMLTPMFEDKTQKEKAEKESFTAKELRISTSIILWDSYILLYDIYDTKIKNCEYAEPDEKMTANMIRIKAQSKKKMIERKLSKYKEIKKGELREKKYKQVCKDLSYVVDTMPAVIDSLKKAYQIALSQPDKVAEMRKKQQAHQQKIEAEQSLWDYVQKVNTYHAYVEYQQLYPKGKYVPYTKILMDDFDDYDKSEKTKYTYKVAFVPSKNQIITPDVLEKVCSNCQFTTHPSSKNIFISEKSFTKIYDFIEYVSNIQTNRIFEIRLSIVSQYNEIQVL